METKISVLVAEPSEEYRAAYAKAIAREADMELVAQTDNGLRAEALVDEFQPDSLTHPSPRPRSRASSPTSSMRSASRRTSRATSTCARRSCWPSTIWTSSIP